MMIENGAAPKRLIGLDAVLGLEKALADVILNEIVTYLHQSQDAGSEMSGLKGMPVMNWKRGLLRIWIASTGAWLILAALFYYGGFTRLDEIERPYTPAECEQWAPELPCPPSHIRALEYERIWLAPSWQFLAGTVAGPLFLFVIGAAGYWVVAGFRRESHKRRESDADLHSNRRAGAD